MKPRALVIADLVFDCVFALASAFMSAFCFFVDSNYLIGVLTSVCCLLAVYSFWRNVDRLVNGA